MRHNRLWIFFLVINILISFDKAYCRPIISGISSNEINIDTSFTGTEILLFGSKRDFGDIVVAIRGPKKDFFLNKKDNFLGVWYNNERIEFKDSYSYYAFFSTVSGSGPHNNLFSDLELGGNNLNFRIIDEIKVKDKSDFENEFVNKLVDQKLYLINSNPIEFLDESLFKVSLKFPKNISSGIYTVEIYLIEEGQLMAFQIIPIRVNQVGFAADIHNLAYRYPFFYGLIAVLIAVIAGWLANYIFNRFFGR